MTDGANGSSRSSDLATRAASVGARLDALYGERRQLALAAADGDRTALKRIEALDALAAKLQATQTTLLDALRSAEDLDRERQQERARADAQRHLAEAGKVATAVTKLSEEIDLAMRGLTQLFERRIELLSALNRSGCLPTNLGHRLASKSAATAAAKSAHLDKYLALELVPLSTVRRLGDTASSLRNALALPEPTSPPPSPPTPSPISRYRPTRTTDDELFDAAR